MTAKQVRLNKERHPEYYCKDPRCLWRTYNARTGEYKPCPKHKLLCVVCYDQGCEFCPAVR